MKNIDICLSPELIQLYDLVHKNVVIVDILRATSCMVSGLAHGVTSITPFAELEACRAMKAEGYLIAGERGGEKVDGFDLGNSPFDYMDEKVKGQKIAVTTTNGTRAIDLSKSAENVIIGAFLNISAVADHLKKQPGDAIIFCAGWKGMVNLEDSLFAAALYEKLQNDFRSTSDTLSLTYAAYKSMKHDLGSFVKNSSHARRLGKLDIHKDITFCMKEDEYAVVPILRGSELVLG